MAKKKERAKGLTIGNFSINTSKNKNEYGKSKKLTIKVGDKEVYSRSKNKSKVGEAAPFKAKNVNSVKAFNTDIKFSKRKGRPSRMAADTLGMSSSTELNLKAKRSKEKSSKMDLGKLSLERSKTKLGRLKQDYAKDKSTDLWVGGGRSVSRTKIKDKTINYSNPEKGVNSTISRSKQKGTVGVKSTNFGLSMKNKDFEKNKSYYYPKAAVIKEFGKTKSTSNGKFKNKTKQNWY